MKIYLSLIAFMLLGALPIHAQEDAESLLIEKLRKVYLNLAPEDSSKEAVALRLADLLAEKGRKLSNEELGRGCSPCKAGQAERKESIELYQSVMKQMQGESLDRVQFQVGYLYGSVGDNASAQKNFEAVIKRGTTRRWVAESQLSLADLDFQARRYESSGRYYDLVIQDQSHPQRGYAHYRKAWCEYQLGRVDRAISLLETILANPNLLSRNADATVVSVDNQFQEEVSRDLASFIPKGKFQFSSVEKLYTLSPATLRVENVVFLAKELERLGQPKQAIEVWNWVLAKQKDPKGRFDGQVHLAELYRQLNDETSSLESFKLVFQSWRNLGCDKKKCLDNYERIKRIVSVWYNAKKTTPSPQVVGAFDLYLAQFPEDMDMTTAASFLARQTKDYVKGMAWVLKGSESVEKPEDREKLLVEYVELAELSNSAENKELAYKTYLQKSPSGKKAFDVRYQLARLVYDKGQYEEASQEFRQIALDKSSQGTPQLRVQALNLSLDALALLKKEDQLATWVAEYRLAFPGEAASLDKVLLKTRLNQSAVALNQNATDTQSAAKALGLLKGVNIQSASEPDQIAYYKNLLIAAERAKDRQSAQLAVDRLLSFKTLSPEDRTYVLSRKAWLAELELDFKTALTASKQVGLPKDKSLDEKAFALKMALLSELANEDPRPYYSRALALASEPKEKALLQAKMVKLSAQPQKELEKSKDLMEVSPEVASEMALDLFAEKMDYVAARRILANPKVASTPSGLTLAKHVQFEDLKSLRSKWQADVFKAGKQKELAKSMKTRIDRITQIEEALKKSNESQDWAIQVLTLDFYESACRNFYQEVISLPIPEGLTPEQQNEYLNQLSQLVGPYQQRAEQAKVKKAELWGAEPTAVASSKSEKGATAQAVPPPNSFFEVWKKGIVDSPRKYSQLAERETDLLVAVAPEFRKSEISALKKDSVGKANLVMDLKELEGRRQAVRDNPFDVTRLKALMEVEQKAGHQAMVAYLKNRIEKEN